jgi:integrase
MTDADRDRAPDWSGDSTRAPFRVGVAGPTVPPRVSPERLAALRRADLPRQRFHDLRHACATLHLEAGEESTVLSRILGHSTISTTADVYAHVTPAMLDRTAERMDGILDGRPTPRDASVVGYGVGYGPNQNGPRSRLRGPFRA